MSYVAEFEYRNVTRLPIERKATRPSRWGERMRTPTIAQVTSS